MSTEDRLIQNCQALLQAYGSGLLGDTTMPEDTNPGFPTDEIEGRLAYFTLPMALNYQRDSFALWRAALATYTDAETKGVFEVAAVAAMIDEELRAKLTKYKLALQPNKHIATWRRISETVYVTWGGFAGLFEDTDNDFLELQKIVQVEYKKGFPYLSGPKIFNYWSYVMSTYGGIALKNRECIDIAPDTHVLKCSVKLGVITADQASIMTRDQISAIWRDKLTGSGIDPIDMHSPLWFWSRGGFTYDLDNNSGV